ncbi:peroxisomal protein importer family [Micromonas pusilla CCMP1545]|uniref:Peroxisomal protein importer family n=1 Tax=Micromonas pusilla (strain CCMP1545) TaxID=564608 RepID=C1MMJ7_MICPC|nr:peroxisomal protein importer family [Micromonas pusilla CCMP1545]EEH58585.1 peroxisomal protein importer family [Micromonas pusilla CCMP1545]|eukprot:XP_003056940.1 peroxisomal protein importer family [Micromonas pusilla CCMP1545]
MSAIRDLVGGGDAGCAAPDERAGSTNPLGRLADAVLGDRKSQGRRPEHLRGGPGPPGADGGVAFADQFLSEQALRGNLLGADDPHFSTLPGGPTTRGAPPLGSFGGAEDVEEFLRYREALDASAARAPPGAARHPAGPMPPPPDHPALTAALRSAVATTTPDASPRTTHPPPPPPPGDLRELSPLEKTTIRDRSAIMARHLNGASEAEVRARLARALSPLRIDAGLADARGMMDGPREFARMRVGEAAGAGSGAGARSGGAAWANEYAAARGGGSETAGEKNEWASEFAEQQTPGGAWASEFREAQDATATEAAREGGPTAAQAETAAQARGLVETLSQNADPKFQNSEFLRFMSRMSKGEIVVEGDAVKETGFANVPDEWAKEFEDHVSSRPDWINENVWDQVAKEDQALKRAERSTYVFTDPNPYLGRADALELGKRLFREGNLSEASLALEAAVRADASLCEAWRLLGTTHAENDDDRRAIAAMTKANEADPTDANVLLALGVSHTNELDDAEATGYMRAWLRQQPRFAAIEAEHEASNAASGVTDTPASVLHLFKRAAAVAPNDADVLSVLGVLAHLVRDYDAAVDAFNAALRVAPSDYSLWNKLGATQANSARSADAMSAYQRALDLKPNYVRAWCNMGIGYANQGKYEESVKYYVRALSMNPNAESAWGYLRISLGCCGRIELMEAVDRKDLEVLQREFPL